MEKILNNLKYNTYGLPSMLNKYIFMERHDLEKHLYFIFQIKSILHETFPAKYECNRLYILNIPKEKNKKSSIYDNFIELELLNTDTLYIISINEYLNFFKLFIDISDTTIKTLNI